MNTNKFLFEKFQSNKLKKKKWEDNKKKTNANVKMYSINTNSSIISIWNLWIKMLVFKIFKKLFSKTGCFNIEFFFIKRVS